MIDPKAAGFRAHEQEQLEARLKLTYRQRLEWLEQAKAFARRAQGAARRGLAGSGTSDPSESG